MARGVGALNVSVNADTGKAIRGLQDLRSEVGKVPGSTSLAASGMSKLGVAGAAAGAAIAVLGASIAAYKGFIEPAAESIDNLAKASDKLGIATEKLVGLRLAADESGVANAAFDKSMVKMLRSTAEAANGLGTAQAAFSSLNLSASQMLTMAPDEQFRLLADSINEIPSAAQKLDIAMSIFGKSGADMVNVLALGKDGFDEAQAAAERMGLAIGREAAADVERANDAIGRIGKSFDGLASSIAVLTAPALEVWANAMTWEVNELNRAWNDFWGMTNSITDGMQEQELATQRAAAAAKALADAEYEVNKNYEKQLTLLREKTAIAADPAGAQFAKDEKEFGRGRAIELQHERDKAEGLEYQAEKEKAALAEEERKQQEAERQKEQKARDAERRHRAEQKKDAQTLADLRQRVADFGKSELDVEEGKTLRGLDDPAQRREAEQQFATLKRMQAGKDELERLRGDRDTLAGGRQNSMLDARSAEGWAALRQNVNNAPELQKLDRLIALQEKNNDLLGKQEEHEVWGF